MSISAPPDHADDRFLRSNPERFGVRIVDEKIFVEDVDLALIAEQVDTPCYVYGTSFVRAQLRGLQHALAARPSLICYAVKANSSQAILRLLK
ncbi:MAG TPA: hypothetical protein ENK31_05600, partial [Nannocystis exedens]|nr:hypothetical protein [Nannocystis exedens]